MLFEVVVELVLMVVDYLEGAQAAVELLDGRGKFKKVIELARV